MNLTRFHRRHPCLQPYGQPAAVQIGNPADLSWGVCTRFGFLWEPKEKWQEIPQAFPVVSLRPNYSAQERRWGSAAGNLGRYLCEYLSLPWPAPLCNP
jgi:hypothetical protein